ncbi:MAG: MFS transporter [Oscillospiraceae bacterium]|nr:MFS transporter [Oscillospiraceae bacterium]
MDDSKQMKRNLILFPLGTVGRDMIYNLFTNFIFTFILFTRGLNAAQLGAISAIMIGARVFDGINDPIMGNIIEMTRTRWGKYKPWLVVGILSTSVVVYAVFNTRLTGWLFVGFFAVIYFLYSITYTMHDISYWGMIPALGTDAHVRDQLTSRTNLFAGIGGTLAGFFIPMLTTGSSTLGGNTSYAYGRVALVICILAPLFLCFTIFGVREHREERNVKPEPFSFRKIINVFKGNDQLLWVVVIFLFQQIGNDIAIGGMASTFIYFDLGYEGGFYSNFSTFGLAATAVLMIIYPMLASKTTRKAFMKKMLLVSGCGYLAMLLVGLLVPSADATLKCWLLTFCYMAANFGNYAFYLILMISIINTVEYNEYLHEEREEALIASVRPFVTKLGSAVVIAINYITYLICGVTGYTQQISEYEQQTSLGLITETEKLANIDSVIRNVGSGQKTGLLLMLTVLPFLCMLVTYLLYVKHYKLDEKEYKRICGELEKRKEHA